MRELFNFFGDYRAAAEEHDQSEVVKNLDAIPYDQFTSSAWTITGMPEEDQITATKARVMMWGQNMHEVEEYEESFQEYE
jgi:hypothetical protein